MAQNLRAKIPEGDVLMVNDRNADKLHTFMNEVAPATATPSGGAKIIACNTAREVAEKSVCVIPLYPCALDVFCVMSMFYR